MKTINVLNLYAGIGGNRKLWKKVDVTAVEINPQIAKIYQDFFPDDKMIITDAHQYLLEHFKEFDFIWSSPPCQSHSKQKKLGIEIGQNKPIYPKIPQLYEEIIFLDSYFKGKWVVENVKSYYKPLIKPFEIGRHYVWSNFPIANIQLKSGEHLSNVGVLMKRKGFDLTSKSCGQRKDQILRNCVEPELGLHIFNMAFKDKQEVLL